MESGPASEILRLEPLDGGLLFTVPAAGRRTLNVRFDGRRVWSFRESTEPVLAEVIPPGSALLDAEPGVLRFQPWPPMLVPWLRGKVRVGLGVTGADDYTEATVELGGSDAPLQLADRFGRPLVVNKWGRLGHAFADSDPNLIDRMLDHVDAVRALLEQALGSRVFVSYGSLLGAIREGRILPHDDDADLAYLSKHSHPADAALESFELGRLLRAAGFEVVRLSAGHLQLHFSRNGVPDHYVDVFLGFLLAGFWYQLFAVRAPAQVGDLLPTVPVMVAGREEPGPRDPEFHLRSTYGPGWRVPDPAVRFEIPPSAGERMYGWFADYNVDREDWEDATLVAPPARSRGDRMSAFVRWVADQTPPATKLLELGCGRGEDALALGAVGRTVRAVDFSRHAVAAAAEMLIGRDVDVEVEVLNLLDTRAVIRLGARAAAKPGPCSVFGRRLLNAIEDRGRDNVFRLCGMLLRRGGAAHFDLVAGDRYTGIAPHRQVSLDLVVDEATRHGLVLEEAIRCVEPMTWFGTPKEEQVQMWRTTFRRRGR